MALVTGLTAFKKTLSAAQGRAHNTVTKRYRLLATNMLRDLAANTPQWSGDLAASWQVMVGVGNQRAHDLGYTDFKGDPTIDAKFIGHKDAVRYALEMNKSAINSIKWNSHVSIQNVSTTLTEGDQLAFVEGASGPLRESDLREGNYIPGDFMAVAFVADKYSRKNMQLEHSNIAGIVDADTGEM